MLDRNRGVLPNIESSFFTYFMCIGKDQEKWDKEFNYWVHQWRQHTSENQAIQYKKTFEQMKIYCSRK